MASALMYMAVLLQLLGAACAQSALAAGRDPGTGRFRLPEGSGDGMYLGFVDENGETHVEYLGKVNTTSPGPKVHLRGSGMISPEDSGVHCQGSVLDASDSSKATDDLANYFSNGGLTFYHSISFVAGTAIAYGCDYGKGQTGRASRIWDDAVDISNTCGGYDQAGWVGHEGWKSSYGRCPTTWAFC